MIADDIRISQFRSDTPAAKEENDDIARLMEASRAISQIIVMRLDADQYPLERIAGWSTSSWSNVVEHLIRAVRDLDQEGLEKE